MNSVLSAFPEGDADNSAECTVCQAYGACRDWIETMADDADVPVYWLAYRIQDGAIDSSFTVDRVKQEYLYHSNMAEYYE